MGKRTKVDKSGLRRLRKVLKDADGRAVKVGILGSAGSAQVQKAMFNEFGTETIPERPFMRTTFATRQGKYAFALQRALEKVVEGKMTIEQALGLIGLEAVKDVQTTITMLREPPNAESTIEKKGSSNPLIDTGRMRQSVSFQIVKG